MKASEKVQNRRSGKILIEMSYSCMQTMKSGRSFLLKRNLRYRKKRDFPRITQWVMGMPSSRRTCVSPTSLALNEHKALPARGGPAGIEETLHPFNFPPGYKQPCWHVLSLMYKMWNCEGLFANSLISAGTEKGSLEFCGVRVLFLHLTSLGCSHRDSGKAVHINSHKLPLQNVRIKSGFLFWGCASSLLTPSSGYMCHHQKSSWLLQKQGKPQELTPTLPPQLCATSLARGSSSCQKTMDFPKLLAGPQIILWK